ncbi:MAG: hypothetical protein ACWA5X_14005 [bacterium]
MDIFAIVLQEMKDNLGDVGLSLSTIRDGQNNASEKLLLEALFNSVLDGGLSRRERRAKESYIDKLMRERNTNRAGAINAWFEDTYQALLS